MLWGCGVCLGRLELLFGKQNSDRVLRSQPCADPTLPACAPVPGVIKSCRFLGRAEVPLSETLDVPAGTPLWFQLMRRGAADAVSGQLQLRYERAGLAVVGLARCCRPLPACTPQGLGVHLHLQAGASGCAAAPPALVPASPDPHPPAPPPPPPRSRFAWDVTAKGLLSIKLHALERVLEQRREILAALQPVPAEVRMRSPTRLPSSCLACAGSLSSYLGAVFCQLAGGNNWVY